MITSGIMQIFNISIDIITFLKVEQLNVKVWDTLFLRKNKFSDL